MKYVYLGFPFPHHKGTHAGYHRIREYLQYDYFINCEDFYSRCQKKHSIILERIFRGIKRRLWDFPIFPYHIFRCILMGLRYDNLVFHFIYSENTYINFRKFIRKTNKIVLTIHQPYEWFDNELWKKKLRSADRIIILSETEKQKFLDLLGGDKVEFIPHGIDVDFYKPSDIQKPTGQILTVGNWLRDFNFADKVYQEIKKKNPNVIINIVSNLENMKFISDNSRINFMSGISDEELRKLYQQSSVLFLPLTRFTANNALLEAASSGCNILIASNGHDKSYLPEKYISILEMDVNRVVERIMEMLNNPVVEAKQLREYVQKEYSWKVIAQQTESIFKKL